MKKELKILLTCAGFSTFVASMLGPIYAIFVEKIDGGILEASYAISIFTLSAGVLIYLISRWEDKYKHQENLLTIGYLINSAGFCGYLFVSQPWHLYIVEAIFGLAVAVLSPVYDGLYSKNLDKGKYIAEWGNWESLSYILSSIAALTGGILVSSFGFEILFFIMFILSLVSVFISLILPRKHFEKFKKKNLY